MRKKINLYMFIIAICSILLITFSITFIFYNTHKNQVQDNLEAETKFYKVVLANNDDIIGYLNELDFDSIEERITIVDVSGIVLFDNKVNDVSGMENHKDRPEVKDAILHGYGENSRKSTTISKLTYYYAVKLDEDTVLRVSVTADSIYSIVLKSMPAIIVAITLISIVSYFLARILANVLVKPINKINFLEEEYCEYEEVSPLINTIKSQKKNMKKQMLEIEERSNTIFSILSSMQEGLIVVDKKKKIVSINNSALKMLNKENIDYKNLYFNEFIRDIDLLKALDTSFEGERLTLHYEKLSMVFQVHLNPVYTNKEIVGIVILFVDITRKASVEKIRREFTANVSHELKTPLTTILGFSEMISSGMILEEDIKKFNQKIKVEATNLLELIEDILLISELDEQKSDDLFVNVNLKTIVYEVVDRLRLIAKNKNVEIDIFAVDIVKKVNERMVVEAIYNLVENAIKYNVIGGKISIRLFHNDEKAILEVKDTGIGISKKYIGRIFERFYCVDKSRSKKTGGTGLGLSIVKNIINYHNGLVDVESEEGVGSTFRVII